MSVKRKPRHTNWPIWHGMKQRCNNQNRDDYKYYGGRGISYDPKWETFQGFMDDMGVRPSLAHTLDRKDSNGNYTKPNCRWATRKEQAQNTKQTKLVLHKGITLSISEWCRRRNLKRSTVASRMNRDGQTAEQALGMTGA